MTTAPTPTARLRRPVDVLRLVASLAGLVLILALTAGLPAGTRELNRDISSGLSHFAHAVVVAVDTVALVATIGLAVVYFVILLLNRRKDAVNAALAAGMAGLVMGVVVTALNHSSSGLEVGLLGHSDGSTMAANTVIVASLTGGDVGHHRSWFNRSAVALVVLLLAQLALGTITPSGAAVVVLAGWAFGLTARLILGASSRRFSAYEVRQALEGVGLYVQRVEELPDRRQVFSATLTDGRRLAVRAVGPDVQGLNLTRRLWNMARLRTEVTGRLPITTRGRMEHEALASYVAASAGVPVGAVVLLAELEDGVVVLAREELEAKPLMATEPSDGELAEAFATLARLHRVGVAHRRLGPDDVVISSGRIAFRDYANAAVAAADTVRRVDVAQLLVAVGGAVGADRAVAAMRAGYGPVDEQLVAATLQPLALASLGRRAMRQARPLLSELRTQLLGEEPQLAEVPEVQLGRFRVRDVITAVAVTFAAYLVIGQFTSINLVKTLRDAQPFWLFVAIVASAATYLGAAINLEAFTPVRLRLLRTTAVEVATAFVGLVTPPTVGQVTVNLRYLLRSDVDAATATGCIAVSQVTSVVTTVVLLLVMGILTGTGIHLKVLPGPRVLAVLGATIIVVGILAAIPFVRRRVIDVVWPRVQAAWPRLLAVLSQPWRLAVGVGGNLLLSVSYVVALIACLHAVGAHPPTLATAVVYLAGNSVGSIAPTPGGIGAVEAVLVAGLTAIGIPGHEAVPAVLLFRVATFWLPILPGWVSFQVLQRRHVL
ncbi:MAG TPA: flippase-like domain-containing protein [Acidimicrobiales bacterium]|nr:flippase-like domain-containing protein [Acidimicrobiales bacterium]